MTKVDFFITRLLQSKLKQEKKMKSFIAKAILLSALSFQNAFAINLTFDFQVNSSGPSIYPCNAGIRHADSARICKDRVTGNTCTPGCAAGNTAECTAGTTSKTCVCTGEENGTQGHWRLDFLKASHADWTDNGTAIGAQTTANLNAGNTNSSWNQVFPNEVTAFGKQLTGMSVNLGSEIYGAEYFVDVCYRGPQIDYTNVNDVNFALKAKVTVNNLRTGAGQPNYQDLATLKTRAEIKCFMDNSFNYCSQADQLPGSSSTSTCGTATSLNYNWTQGIGGTFVPATTSAQELTLLSNSSMGSSSAKVPRFCYVRYYFQESSKNMRLWKLQQAKACTYTEISEPAE